MTILNQKSIKVQIPTYERLLRRKKYPRESFDTAINRILDGDIHEQPR